MIRKIRHKEVCEAVYMGEDMTMDEKQDVINFCEIDGKLKISSASFNPFNFIRVETQMGYMDARTGDYICKSYGDLMVVSKKDFNDLWEEVKQPFYTDEEICEYVKTWNWYKKLKFIAIIVKETWMRYMK